MKRPNINNCYRVIIFQSLNGPFQGKLHDFVTSISKYVSYNVLRHCEKFYLKFRKSAFGCSFILKQRKFAPHLL